MRTRLVNGSIIACVAWVLCLPAPRPVAGQDASATLLHADADAAVAAGLRFLRGRQREDGSFQSEGFGRNVGVCALGGMAFVSRGSLPARGPDAEHVDRCIGYLLAQAQPSGFIQEQASTSYGPMYGHGFATLFLSEVYGSARRPELRDTIQDAVGLIIQSQNSEGGWRYLPQNPDADISVTICQMMALRGARDAGFYVPVKTIDRCVAYVRACQNPDGGFRYQRQAKDVSGERSEFARSAAGLVTLYSAGIYTGQEVDKARNYLQRFTPGPDQRGTVKYFFYGHYYALQAMWLPKDAAGKTWYAAIRDELLRQQRDDGSWQGSNICGEYSTALAVMILQMPRTHLPILQP